MRRNFKRSEYIKKEGSPVFCGEYVTRDEKACSSMLELLVKYHGSGEKYEIRNACSNNVPRSLATLLRQREQNQVYSNGYM